MSQDALCFIRKCSLHFKGEISKTLEESGTSPPYGSPPCFNNECEKKEKDYLGFIIFKVCNLSQYFYCSLNKMFFY